LNVVAGVEVGVEAGVGVGVEVGAEAGAGQRVQKRSRRCCSWCSIVCHCIFQVVFIVSISCYFFFMKYDCERCDWTVVPTMNVLLQMEPLVQACTLRGKNRYLQSMLEGRG
jgi:hypothetical protein